MALAILRSERAVVEERGLTLIGLSVGQLRSVGRDPEQLLLPFGRKDGSRLDDTLDELRDRFGASALVRGSLLHRRAGFEVPKLPD